MQLKFLFLPLFIALFGIQISAQAKMSDAKLSRELVGLWHASPYVASGMNDLFRFYANGRFEFEYNQMVWSKRTISHAGKWRISKGKLILTITAKTNLVGGKKVKSDSASGSADGYEIIDATEVTQKLKRAEIKIYRLGKLQDGEMMKFIPIGKTKYWRLSDDPKSHSILCLGNAF